MPKTLLPLYLLAVCGLLCACGQKGPLYLPQETPPSASGHHSHGAGTSGQPDAETEEEKQKRETAEQSEETIEPANLEPSIEK